MAEAHRWREITNADIARNFYERSMNLFYPAGELGRRRSQPYVGMEFPLMHWIAALLYWPFGEHAVIGRLVSMAFSRGHDLGDLRARDPAVRRRGRTRGGVSDRDLAERGVLRALLHLRHADGVLLGGGGARRGSSYFDTGSTRARAIAGTVCAALAFLVKIPAVLILVPIAWTAWEARRWSALKDRGFLVGHRGRDRRDGLWYWHADAIYPPDRPEPGDLASVGELRSADFDRGRARSSASITGRRWRGCRTPPSTATC